MPTATRSARATIERILKRFTDPAQPELMNLISGMSYAESSTIDDGDYGDPARDPRPAFVKRDNDGWVSL